MQWPIIPIKNLTSLFPLIFLSKHISLHALGRLKWILDSIWPLNQHFRLKNQRNLIKQVLVLTFLSGINCILLHWPKKLTLRASKKLILTYLNMLKEDAGKVHNLSFSKRSLRENNEQKIWQIFSGRAKKSWKKARKEISPKLTFLYGNILQMNI